jgi:RNA-directed DNA polymerase
MATNETDKVRQLQRSLYRKAKQEQQVKFYSLYDKLYREDVLWEAWRQVRLNHGAPGIDGESIAEIVENEQAARIIQQLRAQLRAQTYHFDAVRRVDIPKPQGGTRPLGVATVRDRIVQTAMKLVLEPIFEADFQECSYGYRPKRDAKMASLAIRDDLYRGAWGVVEIDLKSYFTSIPHDKLMVLIQERVVDGSMLKLIKQSLKVGVAYEGKIEPTRVGVPQGSPISPLYSNIYLNVMDRVWQSRGYPQQLGATMHRYADDVILVCRGNAEQALQAFEAIAQRMELTLNREKTRITKLADGFDFIGFYFVKRRSTRSGKPTIYIQPSQTAQQRIRQKIRQITSRRAPILPNEWLQRISLIVRGWVNYYRHTSASQAFRRLQHFINTRFRRYLSYRSKRRGFGWDRYPDWKLYSMGMIYIASGLIKYENRTVNALR